jgi:hypothetical protein
VGTPGIVTAGLELCEDFIDVHADDYARSLMQVNDERRSRHFARRH